MNERPETTDLVTEERLRRAVRFRDAEIRVSPDALSRIRHLTSTRVATRSWQRPGVLIGAAAAIAVVVAGLAFALRADGDSPDLATETNTDDSPVDPLPEQEQPGTEEEPAAEPTPSLLPSTTTAPASTTTLPPIPDLTPQERADQALIVWPLDSRSFDDPSTVVFSYATQALGIGDPVFETESEGDGTATATISQMGEDGQPFGEATRLDLVALDSFNWVIVGATSDELTILGVQPAGEGLADVSGRGRSFEGAARLVARSICDPEGVITPVTVGGGPEFADFLQTVAHVPCDSPLVIELATERVLDTDVPFVTTVAYRAPEGDAQGWAVVGVGAGSVLNVRSDPGVDHDIVATLAADATGIQVLAGIETVDDSVWREIVTPDGTTGWVDSTYLTEPPT
jgi:hypothetical protein